MRHVFYSGGGSCDVSGGLGAEVDCGDEEGLGAPEEGDEALCRVRRWPGPLRMETALRGTGAFRSVLFDREY